MISRSGPEEGTRVTLNDTTNLASSDFKATRKTKFITHGWKSSALSASVLNMKEGIRFLSNMFSGESQFSN